MTFGTGVFGNKIFATAEGAASSVVSAVLAVNWTMSNKVRKEVAVNYEIFVEHANTLGVKYSVLGGVANTLDISWTLGEEVTSQLGVSWTIVTTRIATISNNKFYVPCENRNKPFCV